MQDLILTDAILAIIKGVHNEGLHLFLDKNFTQAMVYLLFQAKKYINAKETLMAIGNDGLDPKEPGNCKRKHPENERSLREEKVKCSYHESSSKPLPFRYDNYSFWLLKRSNILADIWEHNFIKWLNKFRSYPRGEIRISAIGFTKIMDTILMIVLPYKMR